MKLNTIVLQIILVQLFYSLPLFAADSLQNGESIQQVKHDFWIEFAENESSTDYDLTQLELLTGLIDNSNAHIKTTGNLILRSKTSTSSCQVKLPSYKLDAQNTKGDIISLRLSGEIGGKSLSTEFINPSFDEYNQVSLSFKAYIDPTSFASGLNAGDYNYKDNLKINIEFKKPTVGLVNQ